ncbi:MAG: hypothetical protein ABII00_12260, partial [Elusimicrobiota bacterium]
EERDANADGCIDRLVDAPGVVETLSLPEGTDNALTSKLDNAFSSQQQGNAGAAVNKLKAFINSVEAQKGKKISAEDARMLIEFANNVIEEIE